MNILSYIQLQVMDSTLVQTLYRRLHYRAALCSLHAGMRVFPGNLHTQQREEEYRRSCWQSS